MRLVRSRITAAATGEPLLAPNAILHHRQRPALTLRTALLPSPSAVRDFGAPLRNIQWGAVIADEAHRLKNPSSSTAQAVCASLLGSCGVRISPAH